MDAPDALERGDIRGVDFIERRIALVEERAAVRDPILLRKRREVVSREGRYSLVRTTTCGKRHTSRGGHQDEENGVAAMLLAATISLVGLRSDRSHRNSSVGGNERCSVHPGASFARDVSAMGSGLILGVMQAHSADPSACRLLVKKSIHGVFNGMPSFAREGRKSWLGSPSLRGADARRDNQHRAAGDADEAI